MLSSLYNVLFIILRLTMLVKIGLHFILIRVKMSSSKKRSFRPSTQEVFPNDYAPS